MLYQDEYHPKIKNDLKGLDKAVVKEIYAVHLDRILGEPHASDKLQGALEGLFSYHFRKNRIDYRIAYALDENKRVVFVLMIGKRENFYDILKKRIS